jgi:hypothetical protein
MSTKPPIPRIEWPTALVLLGTLAALIAVWTLASPEQRDTMLTGVAALGSVVLAVMRAMLRAQEAEPPTPLGNGADRHDPLIRDDDRGDLLQRTVG